MRVFRVAFVNQGKVYEIYARRVRQGEFYGFVEAADLLSLAPSIRRPGSHGARSLSDLG